MFTRRADNEPRDWLDVDSCQKPELRHRLTDSTSSEEPKVRKQAKLPWNPTCVHTGQLVVLLCRSQRITRVNTKRMVNSIGLLTSNSFIYESKRNREMFRVILPQSNCQMYRQFNQYLTMALRLRYWADRQAMYRIGSTNIKLWLEAVADYASYMIRLCPTVTYAYSRTIF